MMARRGPRTGDVDTRGDILEAARETFAERGFHATTIRSVAAVAGVDPALVMHYFGSKADLFAASIDLPMPIEQARAAIFAGGLEHAGTAIARLFLTVWEEPRTRTSLLAMLRGAFTTEAAATALREFFEAALIGEVATHVDAPDAERRVALVASHLVGLAVLRYVVGFEQLRDASVDELVALVGPRLQSYLTG